jgi:hypothetical protein
MPMLILRPNKRTVVSVRVSVGVKRVRVSVRV